MKNFKALIVVILLAGILVWIAGCKKSESPIKINTFASTIDSTVEIKPTVELNAEREYSVKGDKAIINQSYDIYKSQLEKAIAERRTNFSLNYYSGRETGPDGLERDEDWKDTKAIMNEISLNTPCTYEVNFKHIFAIEFTVKYR